MIFRIGGASGGVGGASGEVGEVGGEVGETGETGDGVGEAEAGEAGGGKIAVGGVEGRQIELGTRLHLAVTVNLCFHRLVLSTTPPVPIIRGFLPREPGRKPYSVQLKAV